MIAQTRLPPMCGIGTATDGIAWMIWAPDPAAGVRPESKLDSNAKQKGGVMESEDVVEDKKPGMSENLKIALMAAVAAVIGALIAFVPAWRQAGIQAEQLALARQQAQQAIHERDLAKREAEALKRQIKEGPKEFVRQFGSLIDKAASETENRESASKLVPYARAIVSQRDALRGELGGLDKLLNSNIDLLGAELAKPAPDEKVVGELVSTIKATWPLKEQEIALRIARLQAVLSFLQGVEPPKADEPKR